MGLREWEEPTEQVEIAKGNFQTVRGLGFEDIARLARSHMPVVTIIFKRFMDEKAAGFTPEGLGTILAAGVSEFPDAVAFVIGLACDDTDEKTLAKIKRMRLTVQAEFIQKIIGLTFVSEAEVKKLIEIVTEMMGSVTSALDELNLPGRSGNGNGAFVSK